MIIAVVGGVLTYLAQRFKILPFPNPDGTPAQPTPVPVPKPVVPVVPSPVQPAPVACSPEHFLPWLLDVKAGKITPSERDQQYLTIIKATLP